MAPHLHGKIGDSCKTLQYSSCQALPVELTMEPPPPWQRHFSKSQQREYFWHAADDRKVWTLAECTVATAAPVAGRAKRPRSEGGGGAAAGGETRGNAGAPPGARGGVNNSAEIVEGAWDKAGGEHHTAGEQRRAGAYAPRPVKRVANSSCAEVHVRREAEVAAAGVTEKNMWGRLELQVAARARARARAEPARARAPALAPARARADPSLCSPTSSCGRCSARARSRRRTGRRSSTR